MRLISRRRESIIIPAKGDAQAHPSQLLSKLSLWWIGMTCRPAQGEKESATFKKGPVQQRAVAEEGAQLRFAFEAEMERLAQAA